MAMRVTGMMSGLDTETIIQELVAAKRTKVDDLKKEQTKLEWKQDAWKELNSKIKKLYTGTLSDLRYQSSFQPSAISERSPVPTTIPPSLFAISIRIWVRSRACTFS